ncbi:MAG: PilW family protein [Magnetococcales bacterium]|nr:PilW family protein [Magnetococcales bacterium]
MNPNRPSSTAIAGFSLVEVMISLSIGLVILMGIISMLANSSRSQKDLDQAGQMLLNGHFAVNELYDDLRNAGYFGTHFFNSQTYPGTSAPDPCNTTDHADLLYAMAMPVHGYRPASLNDVVDFSATSCAALLTAANQQPGSDIVVVRRVETQPLTGAGETGVIYLQANVTQAGILKNGAITHSIQDGTVTAGSATITKLDGTAAEIRKYRVHVYFVAPCSSGSGANGVCAAGDDTIPTLKRLELSVDGGVTTMIIIPLAEGVEAMKLKYGLDLVAGIVNLKDQTGLDGDGIPEPPFATTATPWSQWNSVVAVQVYLLVRTPQSDTGQVDDKTYTLGDDIFGPFTGNNQYYKRHLFSSEVRLVNLAGPRSVE